MSSSSLLEYSWQAVGRNQLEAPPKLDETPSVKAQFEDVKLNTYSLPSISFPRYLLSRYYKFSDVNLKTNFDPQNNRKTLSRWTACPAQFEVQF